MHCRVNADMREGAGDTRGCMRVAGCSWLDRLPCLAQTKTAQDAVRYPV